MVDYSPLKHCFDRKPFKQTNQTALLSAQPQTQQPTTTPSAMKDQCFHTTVPIKNDLKMLKLQAWPQKEDFPRRWLTEGSTVSAVCDTKCTKTLVSEAFVDNLGLRKRLFQEGKSPMVCLGNSKMVAPSAGVEFWATKDTENSWYSERTHRRKISALVLRNLPTEVLMSGDTSST